MKFAARIIIIAVTAVAATGIGAGLHYVQDAPVRERAQAAQVLMAALNTQKSAQTFTTNGIFDINITEPEVVQLQLNFSVKIDQSDITDLKTQVEFTLPLDSHPELAELKNFLTDQTLKISAINIKDVVYFKVPKLKETPFFDTSKVSNQWIKVDPKEFITDPDLQSDLRFMGINSDQFDLNLTQTQEELAAVAFNPDLFNVLTSEEASQNELHLVTQINKEIWLSTYEQLQDILKKYTAEFGEVPETPDPFLAFAKTLGQKDYPKIEFWLDTQNSTLKRAKVIIDINPIFTASIASDPTAKDSLPSNTETPPTGTISIDVNISNINEPVDIAPPAESVSLLEVLKDLFGDLSLNPISDDDSLKSNLTEEEYEDLMRQLYEDSNEEY